jgi:hypothetical protein
VLRSILVFHSANTSVSVIFENGARNCKQYLPLALLYCMTILYGATAEGYTFTTYYCDVCNTDTRQMEVKHTSESSGEPSHTVDISIGSMEVSMQASHDISSQIMIDYTY